MVTRYSTHHRLLVECPLWARRRVTVIIEDWQGCRYRNARYVSTGAAVAAINLTINARTERQWQGIRRPRGRNRAPASNARKGTMPVGTMTRRPVIARADCCRSRIPSFNGSAITPGRCADGLPANGG